MRSLLVDLGRHLSWADATFWRAFERHPPAVADETIRNRLHHVHLVQRAFLWFASGRDPYAFQVSKPHDFPTLPALRGFGEEASRRFAEFVEGVGDDRLNERRPFPFFEKDPPFSLSIAEAITQAVMHSQWHRGQNATRLRELGGEPPVLDLIVWYWKDRPAAEW
jgi:uncharacterized damage-inducible protein DinB